MTPLPRRKVLGGRASAVEDGADDLEARLDERFSHGFEVPEASWQAYTDWVRETEHMQQELVNIRGELAGLPLYGTDESGRGYLLSGFEGEQPVYQFTANVEAAVTTAASYVRENADYLNVHGGGLRVNVNDAGMIDDHPEFFFPNGTPKIISKSRLPEVKMRL